MAFGSSDELVIAGVTTADLMLDGIELDAVGDTTFIAKLDAAGAVLWARVLPDSTAEPVGVAVRTDGTIVLAAHGGEHNKGRQARIETFTPDGVSIGVTQFGGPFDDYVYAVDVDDAGDIYVSGVSEHRLDYPGGVAECDAVGCGYAVRLTAAGNVVYAVAFGVTGVIRGHDIAATTGGGAVLVGEVDGFADFGQGNVEDCAFAVYLDPAGNVIRSHTWPTARSAYGVAVGPSGTVVVTGFFGFPTSFGGEELDPNGSGAFVVALDSAGDHLWSKSLVGATADELGTNVEVGPAGEVLLGGTVNWNGLEPGVESATDLGGGELRLRGESDFYVVELAANGAFAWGQRFGGPDWDGLWDIAVGSDGRLAVAGGYRSCALGLGGPILVGSAARTGFVGVLQP